MDKAKLRVILVYEFRRGTNAYQTVKEINRVFGEGTANEMTVERWFERFRSGDFSLEVRPHGWPKLEVDNGVLKALVESDPSQTTVQLSRHFGISPRTITGHLQELWKVRKLEKWVPHALGAPQKEFRFMASLCHLIRNRNEYFLDRIITCDEKWILYNNRKRKRLWLDKGEAPQKIPNPGLRPKKIMVTVWWTSRGLVHYDFLPPGKTINADYYCLELDTMIKKLATQQPKLSNRLIPLVLQDNSRVHTAETTSAKPQELGLEALFHPPPLHTPVFFRPVSNRLPPFPKFRQRPAR